MSAGLINPTEYAITTAARVAFGIAPITDLVVRFNGPLVVLVWLGATALAWTRRDKWLVAACWGFFAVLLTYKVGNQQFFVSWLALVAALPLLGRPDADRLARLSWPFAILIWITPQYDCPSPTGPPHIFYLPLLKPACSTYQ